MSKAPSFIDFGELKRRVTLEQILQHYDLLTTFKPFGSESLRGCCPIHKGKDHKQFSVTLSKNLWNCFSECKHGGNQLDFVMALEDCSLVEAGRKVNEWFDLGLEQESRPQAAKTNQKAPTVSVKSEARGPHNKNSAPPSPMIEEAAPAEEVGANAPLSFSIQNLDPAHPYLTERGLTEATIETFGLGYCSKGIMAGRIAIPIHNPAGELVGNAGRWPGMPPEDKEKYRLPGKFKKTLEMFNAHRAFQETDDQPLVIVEGFFGAMWLWQTGYKRVVALMGSFMSDWQEQLIANLVAPDSRIVLMLDNDEAGIAAQQKISPRLAEHCWVRAFRWPEGITQPDGLRPADLVSLQT